MNSLIRAFSLLIFISTSANTFCQIKYDPQLSKQYDSVFNKLDSIYKDMSKQLEEGIGYPGGIVLSTIFIDDTLNMEDYVPSTIKVTDSNGVESTVEPEQMPEIFLMLIINTLKGDTLQIDITPWFMSHQNIRHTIVGRKLKTTYNEHYKYDSLLQANYNAKPTKDLTVPVNTVKFILSDSTLTNGKIVYGMAEIVTKDFLYLNAFFFKNNILKHRYRFKYYFKFKIGKKEEKWR